MIAANGEVGAGSPASLSERLADGVLELMAERRLAPGDALPTVRELAGQFGVTPSTMREALRRLQATDAVRLRHGSGIFVGPGVLLTLMPNPNSVPVRDDQVLYLVEARLTIEPGIAALAARHRTGEQLAGLESAVTGRPNFHRELARACGNRDLRQHRAIVGAVRDQDPAMAAELTRQHLLELRASTATSLSQQREKADT
jgi:GntR family transcriptional regulator, transcriptional repressor for pyruvate dehydrogenase complex